MLIIGLVGILQASALANTKIMKRLIQEENLRLEIDAVRALSRPIVAEAIIQFDGAHRLSLDVVPYGIIYEGRQFILSAKGKAAGGSNRGFQPQEILLGIHLGN